MHKKRGQVTIFIIVGIILLFSLALFLYFRRVAAPLETYEVVPDQYVPVQNYIQSCVGKLSRQGIILLGLQGGYLDLPERISTNPDSYLSSSPQLKLPYWYYQGESRIPTIQEMQNDLGNYVSKNLVSCLQDFEPLKQQFAIHPQGGITSRATIGKDAVLVQTTYPLDVNVITASETARLTTFAARVPVSLRRMHELAADILHAENKALYFENITIDLMALGPGDPPHGIPFSDMVFQCGKLSWQKQDVAESIKNRLFYNLPRITFANTRFDPPADLYAANNLHLDVTEEDYSDLDVGVYYSKDWNFLLNVRPSKGNVLSAEYGKGNAQYLSYLCINLYHFTYDLEYPIRVTIRDEEAFDGDGYDFSFATPVMVNHNQGYRDATGFSVFDTPEESDAGYCEQRGTEETVIYAKDAITFDDLRDINVTFSCVGTFKCPLGVTKPDGQVYRLRTTLPSFCEPGSIEAEGPNHIKTIGPVSNGLSTSITLTPKKQVGFEVMKRPLINDLLTVPQPLAEGEHAFIYLTTEAFPEFVQYKQVPLGDGSSPEEGTIELALGDVTYHMDLLVVDQDNNLLGGYRGNWTPDQYQLDQSSTLTLYALEQKPRPVSEEAQALLFMQLENATMQEKLKPVFR